MSYAEGNTEFGSLGSSPSVFGGLPTRPMSLEDYSRNVRFDKHLATVRTYHERVAKGIVIFWGYPDCGEYLRTLLVNGCEDTGYARMGFRAEVLSALMHLLELHETADRS